MRRYAAARSTRFSHSSALTRSLTEATFLSALTLMRSSSGEAESLLSLRPDAGCFDDPAPLVRAGAHPCRELAGTGAHRDAAALLEPVAHRRRVHHLHDLGVQPRHDPDRQARRPEHRGPAAALVAGQRLH